MPCGVRRKLFSFMNISQKLFNIDTSYFQVRCTILRSSKYVDLDDLDPIYKVTDDFIENE